MDNSSSAALSSAAKVKPSASDTMNSAVIVPVRRRRLLRKKSPADSGTGLQSTLGSSSGVDNSNPAPAAQPQPANNSNSVMTLSIPQIMALQRAMTSGPVLVNADGTASVISANDGNTNQLNGGYHQYLVSSSPSNHSQVNSFMPVGTSVNIMGQLVRNNPPATQRLVPSYVLQDANAQHHNDSPQQMPAVIQHPLVSSPSRPLDQTSSHFYGFFAHGNATPEFINPNNNNNIQITPMQFVSAASNQSVRPLEVVGSLQSFFRGSPQPTTAVSNSSSSAQVGNGIQVQSKGPPTSLLRHFIAGQPIFETTSGEDFTMEEKAYISSYFQVPMETEQISSSAANSSTSPSAMKACEFCGANKVKAADRFCNKSCARKFNSRIKNIFSSASADGGSASASRTLSPSELEFMATSPQNMPKRGRPPKDPAAKQAAKEAARAAARTKQKFKSEERERVLPQPVGQGIDNVEKTKIRSSALFRVLLQKKPALNIWTTEDVNVFLKTISGFEAYLSKFNEERIDGEALSLILTEEGMDTMIKDWKIPRGLVFKLDHAVRLVTNRNSDADGMSCLIGS